MPHRFRVDGRVVDGLVGDNAIQRAHELAHVGEFALRNRFEHARLERAAPLLRLAAQDRHAGFVVGNPHVDDQAAGKPRDQPFIQIGDLGGRAIACQYDLVAGLLKGFRQAQELGLHFLPVREELNVVDQQRIDVLEAPAERVPLAGGDRGVECLDVFVEGQVFDVELRRERFGGMPDRHQDVGLA